jgi:hypothetical protein
MILGNTDSRVPRDAVRYQQSVSLRAKGSHCFLCRFESSVNARSIASTDCFATRFATGHAANENSLD